MTFSFPERSAKRALQQNYSEDEDEDLHNQMMMLMGDAADHLYNSGAAIKRVQHHQNAVVNISSN